MPWPSRGQESSWLDFPSRLDSATGISPEAYARIRASPDRFVLKHGHEASDVEQPVEDHGEYIVIEKREGEPTRIAEETDPRS